MLALQLNVDFSDAGALNSPPGTPFGDLTLVNFANMPDFNGLSVRQFLSVTNTTLGGGTPPYAIDDMALVTRDLTQAFESGQVSQFAQQHLRLPCYPDCNLDDYLTVADFGCFQTRFVAGNLYADCTGDGLLTVADFGCFQSAFVAGCP